MTDQMCQTDEVQKQIVQSKDRIPSEEDDMEDSSRVENDQGILSSEHDDMDKKSPF